ncbi:MAG TPA: GNAT family protein [Gaiellaceae bacterium]|nr:GNAT family protein [Gaiellaceae bacterium]HXV95508.1 GNAT family protein [Gaiellaceae bacterium]
MPWEPWGAAARLKGRLVVVEPLGPEHEDDLWEASRDGAVWRWLPIERPVDREAFHSWLEEALARRQAGLDIPFAVVDRASGKAIGSTRYLTLRPEHRGIEIGWTWNASSAWGTGANAEAKLLLLRHAFETLDCMRVEFKTDALNERSRAALEALPARFEGIFVKHMLVRNGAVRDSAYYAITDDEWPAVRTNLERRLQAK